MSSLISSDKIKARHFHSTKGFIHDLCALNDVIGSAKTISDIYPKKLELKFEYQGNCFTF